MNRVRASRAVSVRDHPRTCVSSAGLRSHYLHVVRAELADKLRRNVLDFTRANRVHLKVQQRVGAGLVHFHIGTLTIVCQAAANHTTTKVVRGNISHALAAAAPESSVLVFGFVRTELDVSLTRSSVCRQRK